MKNKLRYFESEKFILPLNDELKPTFYGKSIATLCKNSSSISDFDEWTLVHLKSIDDGYLTAEKIGFDPDDTDIKQFYDFIKKMETGVTRKLWDDFWIKLGYNTYYE